MKKTVQLLNSLTKKTKIMKKYIAIAALLSCSGLAASAQQGPKLDTILTMQRSH